MASARSFVIFVSLLKMKLGEESVLSTNNKYRTACTKLDYEASTTNKNVKYTLSGIKTRLKVSMVIFRRGNDDSTNEFLFHRNSCITDHGRMTNDGSFNKTPVS